MERCLFRHAWCRFSSRTPIDAILLQRSEDGALGIGERTSNVLQARSWADFLIRATAILATAFLSTSLLPAVLSDKGEQDSIFDELVQSQEEEQDSLLTGVPDLVFPEVPDSTPIEAPDPTLSEDAESVVSEVPCCVARTPGLRTARDVRSRVA